MWCLTEEDDGIADACKSRLPRVRAASNARMRLYLALLLWGKTDGEDEPEAREKLTEDDESFCSLKQEKDRG